MEELLQRFIKCQQRFADEQKGCANASGHTTYNTTTVHRRRHTHTNQIGEGVKIDSTFFKGLQIIRNGGLLKLNYGRRIFRAI